MQQSLQQQRRGKRRQHRKQQKGQQRRQQRRQQLLAAVTFCLSSLRCRRQRQRRRRLRLVRKQNALPGSIEEVRVAACLYLEHPVSALARRVRATFVSIFPATDVCSSKSGKCWLRPNEATVSLPLLLLLPLLLFLLLTLLLMLPLLPLPLPCWPGSLSARDTSRKSVSAGYTV